MFPEGSAGAVIDQRHGFRPVLLLDALHLPGNHLQRLVPGSPFPDRFPALADIDHRELETIRIVKSPQRGIATPDFATYQDIASKLPAAATVTYSVLRDGQPLDIVGPHPFLPIVGAVHPKNAAMDAGMQPGDVILSVAGKEVTAFTELPPIVEASAGAPVPLKVWRAGQVLDLTITPNRRDIPKTGGGFETRWLLGLSSGQLFEPETRRAGPWETVKIALNQSWFVTTSSLSGLWHVITGAISTCNISGPIGMAEVMGDAARSGPEVFLNMLAALSLGIGLLNLFPIPVLDGGHLMFYAFEAVAGKPPSERILRGLMTVGLMVVLSFMAFALTNDLFCV